MLKISIIFNNSSQNDTLASDDFPLIGTQFSSFGTLRALIATNETTILLSRGFVCFHICQNFDLECFGENHFYHVFTGVQDSFMFFLFPVDCIFDKNVTTIYF